MEDLPDVAEHVTPDGRRLRLRGARTLPAAWAAVGSAAATIGAVILFGTVADGDAPAPGAASERWHEVDRFAAMLRDHLSTGAAC